MNTARIAAAPIYTTERIFLDRCVAAPGKDRDVSSIVRPLTFKVASRFTSDGSGHDVKLIPSRKALHCTTDDANAVLVSGSNTLV
jgi:hypothetical protein